VGDWRLSVGGILSGGKKCGIAKKPRGPSIWEW